MIIMIAEMADAVVGFVVDQEVDMDYAISPTATVNGRLKSRLMLSPLQWALEDTMENGP